MSEKSSAETLRCMYCGNELPENKSNKYDCEECNTHWVAHNLTVHNDTVERAQRRFREEDAYARYKAWVSNKPLLERIKWKWKHDY